MKPGISEFLERHSMAGGRAYVVTTIAVLAATAMRVALTPLLGDSVAPVFHAVVLVMVASLGGYGPSMYGLVLSLCLTSFLNIHDMTVSEQVANRIAMFVAGTVMCLVTATMRTALLSAAAAQRQANFISREMHHRVKNLFAVVSSLSTLSARERPEARQALSEFNQRVRALSQAHDVAISETTFITLSDLMHRLMSPYRRPVSGDARVILTGEEVILPYGCVTPLGLIFHELATNAVKYGALAGPEGHVHVSWHVQNDTIEITWREYGAAYPAEDGTPGFGTVLVDASVAQMHARLVRERTRDGLLVRLSVPLRDDAGIEFQIGTAGASQTSWVRSRSSLSALPASKRFLQKKLAIRD